MNRFLLRIPVILSSALCLANDPQTPEVATLRAQLAMQIVTCNASEFAVSWKQYQEIASSSDITTCRTDLTALARNLKAHKEVLKSDKLADKAARIRAGIVSVMVGIPGIVLSLTIVSVIVINLCDIAINKKIDASLLAEIPTFAILLAYAALANFSMSDNIGYARHANTQDLTADIDALATIITHLNPEELSPIILAQ